MYFNAIGLTRSVNVAKYMKNTGVVVVFNASIIVQKETSNVEAF